jgi:hypothetical protein
MGAFSPLVKRPGRKPHHLFLSGAKVTMRGDPPPPHASAAWGDAYLKHAYINDKTPLLWNRRKCL